MRGDAERDTKEREIVMTKYARINETDLPAGGTLRWDTPRANQGQIVEVSYSHGWPSYRSEAGHGDPYMRTVDHSDGSVTYAKLVPARGGPGREG